MPRDSKNQNIGSRATRKGAEKMPFDDALRRILAAPHKVMAKKKASKPKKR